MKVKSMFITVIVLCIACASFSSVPAAADAGEAAARDSLIRGQEVYAAFQNAYPGRFQEIEILEGDATVVLDGVRFFWAEGRVLPEEDNPRREEYTTQPFYRYPKTLAPIPEYTPEMRAEMDERIRHLDEVPPARHSGIFTRLWQVHDARSADRMSRGLTFLKKKVRVHGAVVSALQKIEAEIYTRTRTDRELARFVASIRSVSGLYWRKIARTASLSHHAFGTAVDVVSANPLKKETYWLWAKDKDKEWYTRPLETRHMPPASFVEIFERHGFVWGGKWLFFDTLHFEYRPEILLLNGFTLDR